MTGPSRQREIGRGERIAAGVWRLRLPLPWPGVPHCNAFALAAGDGIVLVDCGMHEPGSLAHLERALAQCGLRLEHVKLLVCTHAHSDHYGQAASVIERSGCELWMHPAHEHMTRAAQDPDAALARRIEVARQSGVPEEPLQRYSEARKGQRYGIAAIIEPDRPLLRGVEIDTDLGTWSVHETPGHAPSHVCLFQAERRLLISGDHLLGRVSLFYDIGYSPDPAGEFLRSLDVVEALGARLCLAGHGRTFTDVQAHIDANRRLVEERLSAAVAALANKPLTAFELLPLLHGPSLSPMAATWLLAETLAHLGHLELTGRVERVEGAKGAGAKRWTLAA